MANVKLVGIMGHVKLGSGAGRLDSVGGGGAVGVMWQGALRPCECSKLQFWQMYLFHSTNQAGGMGTCLPMCVSTC